MLEIRDIETFYGNMAILKGISVAVREKEIIAILGANGAGKSTLLNTIVGIVHPRRGSVEFLGQRIDHWSPNRIVKAGISQCPEGRRVFPQMSVLENLLLGAFVRRKGPAVEKDLSNMYRLFPILEERRRQMAGTLSGGEQQMLAMARALMSRPKLILLDEPSLGLAPLMVEEIFQIIGRINQEDTTILLVEQNVRMALQVSYRGFVLETGRIVLTDESQALLNNSKIKEAYLGG
jgi:branched-chain amino acid transport system ATP-binding protein